MGTPEELKLIKTALHDEFVRLDTSAGLLRSLINNRSCSSPRLPSSAWQPLRWIPSTTPSFCARSASSHHLNFGRGENSTGRSKGVPTKLSNSPPTSKRRQHHQPPRPRLFDLRPFDSLTFSHG